jgi:hypothetical protein
MNRKLIILIAVLAFAGIAITFIGALAKLEHWPFASSFLTTGLLLNAGIPFVVLFALLFSNKDNNSWSLLHKLSLTFICVGAACFFVASLAKLEHWPISGIMYIAAYAAIILGVILTVIANIKRNK